MAGACKCGNERSGSIKCEVFLERETACCLIRKGSAAREELGTFILVLLFKGG